jgi:tRNA pseudouridine38-40 synthase
MALNSILPTAIRVYKAQEVAGDFNARLSAKWKRYDYLINNSEIPDVFTRHYSLHEPRLLRVNRMQLAAFYLEGRHNFKAFTASGSSAKSFIRTLYHCRVSKQGNFIRVTCVGDGFLYNMVRIIVGTLLYVGVGKNFARGDTVNY